MANNYYKSGSNNAICDVCGFKHKAADMRTRWDGLFVCREDFEQRQPQDFVKAITDKITVPITRPRPQDVFTDVHYIFDYYEVGYAVNGYVEYS